ncbi:nucleotidyltransferase, putative, partial [Plasmodium ovale curtisi]
IKNSDIDCCIVVENCEDKNSYLYILKVIKSAINLIYPSLTVNIIKASVPIAKIYEEQNNICDISINNTVAIVNTQFVASLCNMDERITIINRIIKYWAKQKNINNRSIERANAASFEINSEYFFLQDEVQMPFYTSIEDIKTKFQNFKKNDEDVSKLLYGFFEFYSNDICKNGITLDIYNNQIIENKDMTANIYCPITKKIVNTYSINTWKKIYDKIHAAYNKLKDGSSLNVICEETKDNTPNRKIDLKDHLLRRKIFQNLCKPYVSTTRFLFLLLVAGPNSHLSTATIGGNCIAEKWHETGELREHNTSQPKREETMQALTYFTKFEIFYLFFIPFTFVSVYIFFLWNVFKYICDVKDVAHFLKLARWLSGKDVYPFEYLRPQRKGESSEAFIVSVNNVERFDKIEKRKYFHLRKI